MCLEMLLEEHVLTKFSYVQSLVWPFTQEAQPGTGEVSCGGDKTDGEQTDRFFSLYIGMLLWY